MFIFNEFKISYFLPSEWDLTIWIALIVTVLLATLFGYYQHKEIISGSRIALLLSFEPIFAAFIGFLFFAEVLTSIEYLGGFLVFSAF
jgi:drug/metabolite transporter (DMT)-like permease